MAAKPLSIKGIKGAMSTRRDSTTDKRQKSQYCLAFPEESRGAAPMAFEGGTESELAKRRAESPTSEQWMEEVCERENCKQALRRVKANKGSPGIDGITVEKLSGHLKEHWPAIRDLHPFYRLWSVGSAEELFPDGWPMLFQVTRQCLDGYPVDAWTAFVGLHSS